MTPPLPGDEYLDIIDSDDLVIGRGTRKEVHGNPALMHRVVHVLVFNSRGDIFLQKRAEDKDVQPGKWDTSVGGHVDSGEERYSAVLRELSEELGIPCGSVPGSQDSPPHLEYLHTYSHSNNFESELVSTWITRWDGPIEIQKSEISEGRFWNLEEIDLLAGPSSEASPFTPNFLDELKRWRSAGSPRP